MGSVTSLQAKRSPGRSSDGGAEEGGQARDLLLAAKMELEAQSELDQELAMILGMAISFAVEYLEVAGSCRYAQYILENLHHQAHGTRVAQVPVSRLAHFLAIVDVGLLLYSQYRQQDFLFGDYYIGEFAYEMVELDVEWQAIFQAVSSRVEMTGSAAPG